MCGTWLTHGPEADEPGCLWVWRHFLALSLIGLILERVEKQQEGDLYDPTRGETSSGNDIFEGRDVVDIHDIKWPHYGRSVNGFSLPSDR